MNIEITSDTNKMVEFAKEIVSEKQDYYTPAVLDSIKKEIMDKTTLKLPEEIENEMYKTIYFYWAYGCTTSEYYFLGLADKTHDEIKEYVLTREKVVYRNYLNRLEDAHILNNKWETYCLFKEFYGRDVIMIRDESDYPEFCRFVDLHPVFVVKPQDMGGGKGVHKAKIDRETPDAERRMLFHKILSECEQNKKQFLRGKENGIILEELIQQVPEMAAFHPESVNAVRATTIRLGNRVHIYHPWFKFGRGGNFLTSALYGTLDAGIDSETGIIYTNGYSENNEYFEKHPDTGLQIPGFQIPKWKELVDTVTMLALKLDTIHYVGWDMVLTSSGWVIMEGNFSGDFMWQLYEKKGSKKEFEDLIGWHLTKEFWWQE